LFRAYEKSIEILIELKNIDKALAINEKAIRRFPTKGTLFFERGEIYTSLARPDTALLNYEKAARLNPDYDDALMKIATTGISIREYYRAVSALDKLYKKQPKSKEINNLLGFCYEKIGDFEKARGYYGTALVVAPGDQDARYGLYRMRQRENEGLYDSYFPEEKAGTGYKLLDTSRVQIRAIQPRGTTNIRVDSSRKAKIE
jgi:tetratricopeptide (TPR) repeat protein